MNFNKKFIAIAAGVALSAAMAVPAMALENEFHGMYKAFGYSTNFFNGATFGAADARARLTNDSHSGFFAEQRARLQYLAKANDNLKLVTQFELDARFGGTHNYKGTTGTDAGSLDADTLTLETKNVYLDFNTLDANFKVGIQPWNDAYKSLFLLADMAGASVTKKFDPFTASLAWFRIDDNTAAAGVPGRVTADLIAVDGKFAVNKDLLVGLSYYNVQNDSFAAAAAGVPAYELLHMFGANASAKIGPAAVDVFAAYQMGDFDDAAGVELEGYMFGTTGKVKVANGAINFAGFYLSGDTSTTGDVGAFQTVGPHQTYFNPANMWLLIRNGQAVNSSTSVLGNDMTNGGRGMWGVFAGYEGKVDKLFYNANAGYAQTAHSADAAEKKSLGTEVNLQVGYSIFDNLQASVAGAYLILGDALGGDVNQVMNASTVDADNPWMANVQLSYTF